MSINSLQSKWKWRYIQHILFVHPLYNSLKYQCLLLFLNDLNSSATINICSSQNQLSVKTVNSIYFCFIEIKSFILNEWELIAMFIYLVVITRNFQFFAMQQYVLTGLKEDTNSIKIKFCVFFHYVCSWGEARKVLTSILKRTLGHTSLCSPDQCQ